MMKAIKTALGAALALACAAGSAHAQSLTATQTFDKLKALEGEWVDVDGAFGKKGVVAVTYRVTSGGHTVIETFPVNAPHEMVTAYYLDGPDLVLTHYCSAANQPHMRAKSFTGNAAAFEFDGGTNIDPAKTSHMHAAKMEFISADEIRATWTNWTDGKPASGHEASFRIVRKR